MAVMGQNLVLNMDDHGYAVTVYNRSTSVVDDFLAGSAQGTRVKGVHTMQALTASLKRPRRVMLMVKAGAPVDACIDALLPLLEPGDIIIDGGNSYYKDTIRRVARVESKGLLYVGTGVSGGEEGARHGPSIMPGGSPGAWQHVRPIFQAIAAKAAGGTPCCDWVGPGGAGHFVKMVHNGIEYGDMQIIAEAYLIMREALMLDNETMSRVFGLWNEGPLNSYLIEITRDILAFRADDGTYIIDAILDSAGQKGTGKWTAIAALEHGVPLTLIGEAVFARFLSALKGERRLAQAAHGNGNGARARSDRKFLRALEGAVFGAKLLSYAQGFMLLQAASRANHWALDLGSIALMWRGGCIIRSGFLNEIKAAYDQEPDLKNLLLAPHFRDAIRVNVQHCRNVVAAAVRHGLPVPALASALTFYEGYRRESGAANLIQAQRDYFGAHTYERKDRPRGEYFHTNWTGTGGTTTAGSYDA